MNNGPNIPIGKYDGDQHQWTDNASASIKDDKEKSPEILLQEIYEQYEKSKHYRLAYFSNTITQHVPLEIQLLADKKISHLNCKLAEKAEKQTSEVIKLTNRIIYYTKWLFAFTIIVAILTGIIVTKDLINFYGANQKHKSTNVYKNAENGTKDTIDKITNLNKNMIVKDSAITTKAR